MNHNAHTKKTVERSSHNNPHTQHCMCSGACGAKCACKKTTGKNRCSGVDHPVSDEQQTGEESTGEHLL